MGQPAQQLICSFSPTNSFGRADAEWHIHLWIVNPASRASSLLLLLLIQSTNLPFSAGTQLVLPTEHMQAACAKINHRYVPCPFGPQSKFAPDDFARNGRLRALVAQVQQEQTSRMCEFELCSLVGVQHIVLLQQLLCNLQNFVVEGEPWVLTDDTENLRIS